MVQGGSKGLPIPGLTMTPTEYFRRQCFISADPDDPGIKQVIDTIGDENVVVATDFGHPEGRHNSRAVEEVMTLSGGVGGEQTQDYGGQRLSSTRYGRTRGRGLSAQ